MKNSKKQQKKQQQKNIIFTIVIVVMLLIIIALSLKINQKNNNDIFLSRACRSTFLYKEYVYEKICFFMFKFYLYVYVM